MAEPTLAEDRSGIRSKVGYHLGYQRDATAWNDDQADDVDACLQSGQRMVYNCGYDWAWLKPVAALTLAEGASSVRLPDDYAAADGPVVVSTADSSWSISLLLGPWQPIYEGRARQADRTGPPLCLSHQPVKGTSLATGQRFEFQVFPAADQDYTLTFAYRVNADAFDAANPFPYGGAQHAELFLQACKAAAERDIDNIPPGTPAAVHQASFGQMLEQAKQLDRRTKPHTVGYNRDMSDRRRRGWNEVPRPLLPIIVETGPPS